MATKLNQQEIEAIKDFQQKTQNVIMDLGKIELQLSDLESVKAQVMDIMKEVNKEQTEFFKKIEETYGKGQINLETYEHIATEVEDNTVYQMGDDEVL
jgi:chaperonin cofactor prefoldin